MEKRNKILRHYRLNPMVYDEMQKLLEKINISETSFIEIAIIEKMARIQEKEELTINITGLDEKPLRTIARG